MYQQSNEEYYSHTIEFDFFRVLSWYFGQDGKSKVGNYNHSSFTNKAKKKKKSKSVSNYKLLKYFYNLEKI